MMLLALLLIIPQTGCSKKVSMIHTPLSQEGFYLDTICQITVYATSDEEQVMFEKKANEGITKAFELCDFYEKLLSKTIPSSDISRINNAEGAAISCDPNTIKVIQDGIKYGQLSKGYFNIGIGPVVDLWDFHAEDPKVPNVDDIREALNHVKDSGAKEYDAIKIEEDKVSLADPKAKLDLGAIAKGFIADRMAECLIEEGVAGAVIDLGGNIVIIGSKDGIKGEDLVKVGIKKPYSTSGEIVGSLELKDACVVTSGVYERYFEVKDSKYHHVIDPKTGYPSKSELDSVTVIGPLGTSEDCDALATTGLIRGEKWIAEIAATEEFSGYTFITIHQDGSINTLGDTSREFIEG